MKHEILKQLGWMWMGCYVGKDGRFYHKYATDYGITVLILAEKLE